MWTFEPILKKTIWGGTQLSKIKGSEELSQDNFIGESWELSAMPGNESIVKEGSHKGESLLYLIRKYGSKLLGEENLKRYGHNFPLLIKYIDAAQDLSVQVHPDDEMALRLHNSMGKAEMWYVADCNSDSYLYCGFNQKVSIDEYDEIVSNGTIIDKLNKISTKPGDIIYVPAGRIHAIGTGNLIVEIQESSDITYRVYDYNRKDANGKCRELHTELAKQAIKFNGNETPKVSYDTTTKNKMITAVSSPMFTTNIIKLTEPTEINLNQLDSFAVFIVVEGKCNIISEEPKTGIDGLYEKRASAGTTILVPATTDKIKFTPQEKCTILMTFIEQTIK